MRAAQVIDGIVINIIEVDSLDLLPDLVDAGMANIGDSYADGIFTPKPIPAPTKDEINAPILAQIKDIETNRQPRAQRDAILTGNISRLQAIDVEITALRHTLVS